MLLRAARRKSRLDANIALDAASQGLLLPFLCPALTRWTATTSRARSDRTRASIVSPAPTYTATSNARHLASIATSPDTQSYDRHAAMSNSIPQLHWDYPSGSRNSRTAPYEPIILRHDLEPATARVWNRNGIPSTTTEIMQSIYACLRVNRYDRALACIERLAAQPGVTAAELEHAHELYMTARLEDLATGPGIETNYDELHRFYRYYIKTFKLPFSQKSIVALVKAGLQTDMTNKIRRLKVRRIIKILPIPKEILLSNPIFTNDEYSMLCRWLYVDQAKAQSGLMARSEVLAQDVDLVSEKRQEPRSHGLSKTDMPQILKTDQKGLSLDTLKRGLAAVEGQVSTTMQHGALDETSLKLRNIERETLIETTAANAAVQRWKAEEEKLQELGVSSSLRSRPISALMWTWYSALLPVIQAELAEIKQVFATNGKNKRTDDRVTYGPQLESLSAGTLASNTILYVMNMVGRGKDRETDTYQSDLKLTSLAAGLGKVMQDESNAQAAGERTGYSLSKASPSTTRPQRSRRSSIRSPLLSEVEWSADVRIRVGVMLVSKLMETAMIPMTREHPRTKDLVTQSQPAFLHQTKYRLGKKQGYLSPAQELLEKLHKEPLGDVICKKLPMIAEPRPWTSFRSGGYLTYATDFIRFPPTDASPKDYAKSAIARGDMDTVFRAINSLSKIPWRINRDVLRVQIEAWNAGETVGSLAPLNPTVEFPPEPSEPADLEGRRKWLETVKELRDKQSGLHSLRCHQNLQLETARAFQDEVIYLPHNIDFRGRAYPIPPYLNHMGADNARALVIFAQGKPLGEHGLRWLKIHLANVAGYDKASLQERVEYVMDNLADIYDSAERPLQGRRWWAKSDDAWQTLAACIELRDALESPDPAQFVSQLPIHQDGTCNGLQHYAALGGDEIGARQVNLEPGDRPSDIYSAVADSVRQQIEEDRKLGDPRAEFLDGHVGRRIVKQPVMTNVYGVTGYGMRAQVRKQLEDVFPNIVRTDDLNYGKLAFYITTKITKSLNQMFNGAQAIQEWFGKCGDRITNSVTAEQVETLRRRVSDPKLTKAKEGPETVHHVKNHFKSSIIWTTPLRLPVVQPYRVSSRTSIKTAVQLVSLVQSRTWDPIHKRKQLQGFPPNFIHSLDASHMMLSAIKCEEKDIAFASIHDSFWTHACSVDSMSEVLRDAFVDMHSENIVGRLREEFTMRYKGNMYLAHIRADSSVGKQIRRLRDSRTAERLKMMRETGLTAIECDLYTESERQRLLSSSDPEEREEGTDMVTPGSLVEASSDEASMIVPKESIVPTLGKCNDVEGMTDKSADLEDSVVDTAETTKVNLKKAAKRKTSSTDLEAQADSARYKKVYAWLPMSFPEIPQKGTFDVKRLKESRYFFH